MIKLFFKYPIEKAVALFKHKDVKVKVNFNMIVFFNKIGIAIVWKGKKKP